MNKPLYSGISSAAWGLLFLNFSININLHSVQLPVLGRWAGCLFIICAIKTIENWRPDIGLITNVLYIMLFLEICDIALSIFFAKPFTKKQFISVIQQALVCYTEFSVATNIITAAEKFDVHSKALPLYRNISVISLTVFTLVTCFVTTNKFILAAGFVTHLIPTFLMVWEIFVIKGHVKTKETKEINAQKPAE